MHTITGWVRGAVVLTVAGALITWILKHLTASSGGTVVLPPISGDTWPPVPVKTSARTT